MAVGRAERIKACLSNIAMGIADLKPTSLDDLHTSDLMVFKGYTFASDVL